MFFQSKQIRIQIDRCFFFRCASISRIPVGQSLSQSVVGHSFLTKKKKLVFFFGPNFFFCFLAWSWALRSVSWKKKKSIFPYQKKTCVFFRTKIFFFAFSPDHEPCSPFFPRNVQDHAWVTYQSGRIISSHSVIQEFARTTTVLNFEREKQVISTWAAAEAYARRRILTPQLRRSAAKKGAVGSR